MSFNRPLPISVIIATRNEENRIARALEALGNSFGEIWVVDSQSSDKTKEIASSFLGVRVVDFVWNGAYPKKRQWCLDNLDLGYEWVLFIDADEYITPQMIRELKKMPLSGAGYFITGAYIFEGRSLRFGLKNNKLALINRHKMMFPVVDDLDISGMGEIEGHYQPVLKSGYKNEPIGQIKNGLYHDAYGDVRAWKERHERYASWEIEMDRRWAWPQETSLYRRVLKRLFKNFPWRGNIALLHSYILKLGFLDGPRGWRFARTRKTYYDMIARQRKNQMTRSPV